MTITMYGAQWCGDCRRAKKFFDDNEIEFTYVNLEDDPEQTKVVLERNGGVKRIPVIVFPDDSHLVEPSNDELAKKMAELSETGGTAGSDDGLNVVRNSDAGRFELFDGTELLSFASYSMRDNTVVIPHVETVPAHRGNGHAARLLEGTLDIIRSDEQTVVPLCPFAARHIRDNAEHHDLLASR